ncbi:DUF4229 domain-containing protein [Nocardioides sp.]|uniref:DUF4229 domain-containing protein n=1 Tax=Nocardioides sp. TaxID=35761 RepID=UPI00351234E7
MKEFVVYTALRLLLFAVTWGAVSGAWALAADDVPLGLTFLIAFALSGVGSYYALRHQREAFAQRVEARAARATERFEELKAREDVDD